MEGTRKWKKANLLATLLAVLAVVLCSDSASRAGFVTVSGPIYDPPTPPDTYYWIVSGVTVKLYASGSYDVYIDDGGTVNFKAGASAGIVSANVGSTLNMEGGTVSGTIVAQGGVSLTIFGTYDSMVTTSGAGHYDPVTNQVVVDDGTEGWNGNLIFTYEGDTTTTTLTFSTLSNIKFDSTGSDNQAPAAYAGEDVSIFTSEQSITVLLGTATDVDGDALIYRWLDGSTQLKGPTNVPDGGEVTLDLAYIPAFDLLGVYSQIYTLTLEVSEVGNGGLVSTDLMDLSVFNSLPDVTANPPSMTVGIGDPISIGVDVADFDGDALTYEWRKGATILASGNAEPPAGGDWVSIAELTGTGGTAPFELGPNVLVIAANDGVNSEFGVVVTVNVPDTEAPTLAPTASKTMLWPPNHQLIPITIQANAEDNSGGPVTLDVEVTSNEPDEADWVIDSVDSTTGEIQLRLRAERSGSGDGRVYTVTITATDEADNSSTAIVEIRVPHDKRKK